jgi:hypothetical protein
MTIELSPAEQVLTELGRQKWAADFHDEAELRDCYTEDSTQVVYVGGPEGRTELFRSSGREDIVASNRHSWDALGDGWYPGKQIHLIGSPVIDPIDDTHMRCRSYAAVLRIGDEGEAQYKGHLTYDDVWRLDRGRWRLASRETVVHGHRISGR